MKKIYFILVVFGLLQSIVFSQQKGVTPIQSEKQNRERGNTYAIVVGISDYQDPAIPDLRFADKDAEAFANFLRSESGGKLNIDHLKVLINQQATMAQFANSLDWLWEVCKEGDQAIIYFSGHGDVEKKSLTQPGFLLCWDAPARIYMAGGAFALPMLQEVVSTLSIQNKAKVLVITDACRSGKLAGSSVGGSQATAANLAKQFGNEIKIMSCQPNEYSIEGEQWGGGRGAFSYHLIDALYGLADKNNDQSVSLQEVGRYLEDHVSGEVAPVSQVPMIIGNRSERLSIVDNKLLTSIKSGKTNQMAMLSPIASKGLEDEILSQLDTSVRELYSLFNKSLNDKAFFEPSGRCSEIFYSKLLSDSRLTPLYSTMTRNYAAALQDDAQQAINIYLKADIKQLQCIGKTLKLEPIPRQLARAAELLGESHYMFNSLKARQLLFDGQVLFRNNIYIKDLAKMQRCIECYQRSLVFEPNSALAYNWMSAAFANLQKFDSAEILMNTALDLAPNWVLPLTDYFNTLKDYELDPNHRNHLKKILGRAIAIDSTHGYCLNAMGQWLVLEQRYDEAIRVYEKYEAEGGATYPCWYYNLGDLYEMTHHIEKAERALIAATKFDSTNGKMYENLSYYYLMINKLDLAEKYNLKAIEVSPKQPSSYWNHAFYYEIIGKRDEAFKEARKALDIDSTDANSLSILAHLYTLKGNFKEADILLQKALASDSLSPSEDFAFLQFRQGNNTEARKWAMRFITRIKGATWSTLYMAAIECSEKKYDEAFEWLEKSMDGGMIFCILNSFNDIAELREMPQWKVLVNKHYPYLDKN